MHTYIHTYIHTHTHTYTHTHTHTYTHIHTHTHTHTHTYIYTHTTHTHTPPHHTTPHHTYITHTHITPHTTPHTPQTSHQTHTSPRTHTHTYTHSIHSPQGKGDQMKKNCMLRHPLRKPLQLPCSALMHGQTKSYKLSRWGPQSRRQELVARPLSIRSRWPTALEQTSWRSLGLGFTTGTCPECELRDSPGNDCCQDDEGLCVIS